MGTHYKHLSMDERNTIHHRRLEGASLRAIARELARPASTVAREVARNQPTTSYDAGAAARRYHRHRWRGRRKLAPGTALWHGVVMDLYRGWSPEQIAGWRRRMYPDEPAHRVSHETIYLALYALPRGELRTALLAQLRQGHKTRRPRGRGQDRRGGLKNMTSIHDRPAEVADRLVPGHWEGDLIKGAGNRSAVGTLVERTSRYVVLARMDGHPPVPAPPGRGPQDPDLRPGQGDGAARGIGPPGVDPSLLRRPAQSLAAAQQRKRQRPDPGVPAQKHGPVRRLSDALERHRSTPQ